MRHLQIPRRGYKIAGGAAAELVGRLKPNGRLRERSPLTDLVEVDGLVMGIRSKQTLWRNLRDVAGGLGSLTADDLDALVERADAQLGGLERCVRGSRGPACCAERVRDPGDGARPPPGREGVLARPRARRPRRGRGPAQRSRPARAADEPFSSLPSCAVGSTSASRSSRSGCRGRRRRRAGCATASAAADAHHEAVDLHEVGERRSLARRPLGLQPADHSAAPAARDLVAAPGIVQGASGRRGAPCRRVRSGRPAPSSTALSSGSRVPTARAAPVGGRARQVVVQVDAEQSLIERSPPVVDALAGPPSRVARPRW